MSQVRDHTRRIPSDPGNTSPDAALRNEQDPSRHLLAVLDVLVAEELDEHALLDCRASGSARSACDLAELGLTNDPAAEEAVEHYTEGYGPDWVSHKDLLGTRVSASAARCGEVSEPGCRQPTM